MNVENKVSVVIPTLGGQCLVTTIQQLNSGTLIPDEILICIPEEEAYKLVSLDFQNTKVLKRIYCKWMEHIYIHL